MRLSLRVMLLLVAVAALLLGWRVDKSRRQRLAITQVEKYNGYVRFDYEYANGKEIPKAQPKWPRWLRRNLGDEYFRKVSRVIYVDQPLSDATLLPLTGFDGIEELCFLRRIHHTKNPVDPPPGLDRLTEAGLSRLEGLTHLRRLEVEDMELSGSMLQHLSRSTQLEELKIFEGDGIKGGISDDGMPPLGTMPGLRLLSLWCHRITGSCLEPLRGSRNLEELQFYGSPITAAGFANIGAIMSLKDLYFNQVDISDSNLSELRKLTGLTRLTLNNNQMNITDAGLVHLRDMTHMEWLDLTGCHITGRGLGSLKGMIHLKGLSLGWTQVDDSALEVIASFPELESLELYQSKVTDAGILHLRILKNLKKLSVGYTAVTPEAVDELKKAIPTLREAR
jgi:hypothetical protein